MDYNIRRLSRETWTDFVRLFEQDRMTSQCWCLNHRVQVKDLVIEAEAKEIMQSWVCPKMKLRAVTSEEVPAPTVHGLLLYEKSEDTEEVIGWVGVEPLQSLIGHDCAQDAQEGEWSIHCVYLLKNFRSKGLTDQLIRSAIDLAREKGAKLISAFPCPRDQEAGMPESMRFGGRIDSYLAAGFQIKNTLSDLYQRLEIRF
ncbi:MAG: GNAT family N-acetyltransferase [Bdellovibrionota bacterium]